MVYLEQRKRESGTSQSRRSLRSLVDRGLHCWSVSRCRVAIPISQERFTEPFDLRKSISDFARVRLENVERLGTGF